MPRVRHPRRPQNTRAQALLDAAGSALVVAFTGLLLALKQLELVLAASLLQKATLCAVIELCRAQKGQVCLPVCQSSWASGTKGSDYKLPRG